MQEKLEGTTNSILLELQQHYSTDYNPKALFPIFESIVLNLQSICTIYGNFPKTCIQLLNQVKLPFDERDYLQKVSNPIRFFGVRNQNSSYFNLAQSLEYLRTLLSQNEQKLKDIFSQNIELMPGDDKNKIFAQVVNEACTKAIDMAIVEMQLKIDCIQEEEKTSVMKLS